MQNFYTTVKYFVSVLLEGEVYIYTYRHIHIFYHLKVEICYVFIVGLPYSLQF